MSKRKVTPSSEELLKTVKALNEVEKSQEIIDLLPENLLETYKSADLYAEKEQ
jgi:hypothetical protein